jgi:hypothetical protein
MEVCTVKTILAVCLATAILIYALYRKDDVKAGFKTPLIEFSLDAKDRDHTEDHQKIEPSNAVAPVK